MWADTSRVWQNCRHEGSVSPYGGSQLSAWHVPRQRGRAESHTNPPLGWIHAEGRPHVHDFRGVRRRPRPSHLACGRGATGPAVPCGKPVLFDAGVPGWAGLLALVRGAGGGLTPPSGRPVGCVAAGHRPTGRHQGCAESTRFKAPRLDKHQRGRSWLGRGRLREAILRSLRRSSGQCSGC